MSYIVFNNLETYTLHVIINYGKDNETVSDQYNLTISKDDFYAYFEVETTEGRLSALYYYIIEHLHKDAQHERLYRTIFNITKGKVLSNYIKIDLYANYLNIEGENNIQNHLKNLRYYSLQDEVLNAIEDIKREFDIEKGDLRNILNTYLKNNLEMP